MDNIGPSHPQLITTSYKSCWNLIDATAIHTQNGHMPASCLASSSGTAWAGGACAMVLAPDTKLLVRAEVEAAL